MNRKETTERVASGLRKMIDAPDAFVLSPYEEDTWDEDTICGIPVYHFDIPVEYTYNGSIVDPLCYFMPVWKKERSMNQYLSKQFFLGWEEFCNDPTTDTIQN